ncbi:hypothetical protein KQX54_016277 [Cotesia glomerata]|uniref:Uncharacterized protein n=1 Tax=Cotesia glomerata TaxID=32391 RepID=A0AAV7IZ09_COTGL|nr:hypothetical protein KQX54_016277 [Cotesia glomerata]
MYILNSRKKTVVFLLSCYNSPDWQFENFKLILFKFNSSDFLWITQARTHSALPSNPTVSTYLMSGLSFWEFLTSLLRKLTNDAFDWNDDVISENSNWKDIQ